MNKFEAVGRITKDLELKTSQNGKSVLKFTVATQRKFKNSKGEYESDFLPCVAFEKTAEFISKYFSKGSMIGVTGRIQTGSYTNKNGDKVFTVDLFVEEAEFTESKGSKNNEQPKEASPSASDGFMNIPDGIDEELPFT